MSRHEDVLAAFRNLDGFSNAFGVSLEPSAFGPDAHRFMSFLALDPPRHTRMRSLVGKGFTPSKVAQMEDRIRAIALEHLEPALDSGTFDFIGDFAGKLPMDVISELVGVPPVDRAEVRRLADLVVHREDGLFDVPPAGMEAAFTLVGYYQDMVDERRRHPEGRPDLGTPGGGDRRRPAHRRRDHRVPVPHGGGGQRDHHQAAGQRLVLGMAPSGRGGQAVRRAGPGGRLGRGDPPLRHFEPDAGAGGEDRPVELHGTTIPEGDRVLLLVGSANRDESVFPDADRYDLDRDTSRLVSFGSGRHFCMGAPLARLEARIGLGELTRRVADYDVDPDGIERVHSVNVRGLAALPTTVSRR